MAGQRVSSDHTVSKRLGSFALVLAGTFGTAYALGERLPGHDHSGGSTHDHGQGSARSPIAPAFEMAGYQLVTEQVDASSATFHLLDPHGDAVKDFAQAHGALLHVVLVRPDLSGFQHVHPAISADGSWTVTINEPGQWHVVFESTPIADGAPLTRPIVVSVDLDDDTVIDAVPLPPVDDVVEVDGLLVARTGFVFTVTNADGTTADNLEPYLEQVAHLIAFREGDLAFTHFHPFDGPGGTFDFGQGGSESGRYRVFLQFGHAGSVVTVPFTVVIP